MLERLRRIADAAQRIDVSDRDVVHYDFSPHNVLVDDDRITGVVDWDGATNGDAAFDLVTLASFTYDYAVRDELLAARRAADRPAGARALRRAHGAAPGRLVAAQTRATPKSRGSWIRSRPVGGRRRWVASNRGDHPHQHAARARRRRVRVDPARRRVGREQRGRDRRRRRHHRGRHAHGALAVGAVRGRGREARPPGAPARAHARAHRPRRRLARVRRTRRCSVRNRPAISSTARCRSSRTRRSCPRSTRSSTSSPRSAPARSRTS